MVHYRPGVGALEAIRCPAALYLPAGKLGTEAGRRVPRAGRATLALWMGRLKRLLPPAVRAFEAAYTVGFRRAMATGAVLAIVGGVVAFLNIRNPSQKKESSVSCDGPWPEKRVAKFKR